MATALKGVPFCNCSIRLSVPFVMYCNVPFCNHLKACFFSSHLSTSFNHWFLSFWILRKSLLKNKNFFWQRAPLCYFRKHFFFQVLFHQSPVSVITLPLFVWYLPFNNTFRCKCKNQLSKDFIGHFKSRHTETVNFPFYRSLNDCRNFSSGKKRAAPEPASSPSPAAEWGMV